MKRRGRRGGPVGFRGFLLVLALSAAIAACQSADPAPPPKPSAHAATPSAKPVARACGPVAFGSVLGPRPSYGSPALRRYAGDESTCAGWWLAGADDLFVPQSLVLRGNGTAIVGGFRWHRTYGERPCQLVVVDVRTGATRAFVKKFQAPVYRPQPTFCRHGGGMQETAEGLWVLETQRLWLLDPDRLGRGDPVKRVWRLGPGVRGSALIIDRDRLGIASYESPHGTLLWWRIGDVTRRGVDDLLVVGARRSDARSSGRQQVPARVQGIASGPGGLWFAVSNSRCGLIRGPRGEVAGSVPGIEGFRLQGRSLWAVTEASARAYTRSTEPLVPMLVRQDLGRALRTRPVCQA